MRGVHRQLSDATVFRAAQHRWPSLLRARRIYTARGPSPLFRLDFWDPADCRAALAEGLPAFGRVLPVEPCQGARLTPCRRCCQYGHTSETCSASPRCHYCGAHCLTNACTSHDLTRRPVYCATCGCTGHYTGQAACPRKPRRQPPAEQQPHALRRQQTKETATPTFTASQQPTQTTETTTPTFTASQQPTQPTPQADSVELRAELQHLTSIRTNISSHTESIQQLREVVQELTLRITSWEEVLNRTLESMQATTQDLLTNLPATVHKHLNCTREHFNKQLDKVVEYINSSRPYKVHKQIDEILQDHTNAITSRLARLQDNLIPQPTTERTFYRHYTPFRDHRSRSKN